MKKLFFVSAAILLLAVSCQQHASVVEESQNPNITQQTGSESENNQRSQDLPQGNRP